MKGLISMAALAAALTIAVPAHGSDAGYIYGRVTTDDGETYQGQLRWGSEEAFWEDMFNATKARNEFVDYLDHRELRHLRRDHGDFWERVFESHDQEFGHVFAVRFGDLKRIEIRSGSRLTAVFRNGDELELRGGSNDVGARITVIDAKAGTHKLGWSRIRTVEFTEAPQKIERKFGEPLYGTVQTRRGAFTGYIQWDNDECLSTDELDGDDRDGDISIPFRDIKSIRKHRSGSLVALDDGTELYLTGSNDVNSENRGVVVKVPGVGSVKIGWEDFESVAFQRPAPGSGLGYAEFGNGAALAGVVESREGRYQGRIVFDLDESWDFELLQGKDGDIEYQIPFRDIERITPRSSDRTEIQLRSGKAVTLDDGQDVTRKNDGLLVFDGDRKPTYVEWRDVKEIRFGNP